MNSYSFVLPDKSKAVQQSGKENVMETIDIQSGNMQKTEAMTGEVM